MQKNVTIPRGSWEKIEAAMVFDGVRSFSQFALAAINQRVARLERMKALEEKNHPK